VGGDCSMTVLHGSSEAANRFALLVVSVRSQEMLAKHGFSAPALP